jgi:lauroyl/myristoyl acyltransferase
VTAAVVNLADVKNDNTLITPVQMLRSAADDLEAGESKVKANKAVVLLLDANGSFDGAYFVGFYASNIRTSEIVALLETAKQTFVDVLLGKD